MTEQEIKDILQQQNHFFFQWQNDSGGIPPETVRKSEGGYDPP